MLNKHHSDIVTGLKKALTIKEINKLFSFQWEGRAWHKLLPYQSKWEIMFTDELWLLDIFWIKPI